MPSVFISYSSKDVEIARSIHRQLEASGTSCWIAENGIRPSENYGAAIISALNAASHLVLILTSNSNISPEVHKEIERASSKRKPIIPVRFETVNYHPALEYHLGTVQWIDAIGYENLEVVANQIREVVSFPEHSDKTAVPVEAPIHEQFQAEASLAPKSHNSKVCEVCGTAASPETANCSNCGERLPTSCPQCQHANQPYSTVCANCGINLASSRLRSAYAAVSWGGFGKQHLKRGDQHEGLTQITGASVASPAGSKIGEEVARKVLREMLEKEVVSPTDYSVNLFGSTNSTNKQGSLQESIGKSLARQVGSQIGKEIVSKLLRETLEKESASPSMRARALDEAERRGRASMDILPDTSDAEGGSLGEVRLAFWIQLVKSLKSQAPQLRPQKPLARSYLNAHSIRKGLGLVARTSTRPHRLSVELYIEADNAKKHFENLLAQKGSIEKQLGFELIWDDMVGYKAFRIATYLDNAQIDDPSHRKEHIDWLIARLIKMESVFGPVAENLVRNH